RLQHLPRLPQWADLPLPPASQSRRQRSLAVRLRRFSYERYDTDRVVVPKVRTDDDYLGIATWSEALDAIDAAFRKGGKAAVIASAQMTNEEAAAAKALFAGRLGASIGVLVDPIGPIK